jgi:hypothetical protein
MSQRHSSVLPACRPSSLLNSIPNSLSSWRIIRIHHKERPNPKPIYAAHVIMRLQIESKTLPLTASMNTHPQNHSIAAELINHPTSVLTKYHLLERFYLHAPFDADVLHDANVADLTLTTIPKRALGLLNGRTLAPIVRVTSRASRSEMKIPVTPILQPVLPKGAAW